MRTTSLLSYFFLIVIFLVSFSQKTTFAWTLDPGDPLYATALGGTSQATYSEGPIYVPVGGTVYFKADAPSTDRDTAQWEGGVEDQYDSVNVSWSFGSSQRETSLVFNTAGTYNIILSVNDGGEAAGYYDDPSVQDGIIVYVVKVEAITGLQTLYCTHQDCSQVVTANLTGGIELPAGYTIVWGGDATFSNQSGRTATAKFTGHAGKNLRITAALGAQTSTISSAFTVVDYTSVTGVTAVTYSFVYQAPTAWGVTSRGPIVVDITAYFDHPSHIWQCKVTTSTSEIRQGSRLLPGVNEANVAAATTETIYQKMCVDLISRGALPCSWYMLAAVEAHEKVHSDAWQAINNPLFTTFRNTVEGLNVPYADTTCETPAQAKTAIRALLSYTTAETKYISDGTTAWIQSPPQHPGSDAATNAAEDAVTRPMVNALDVKAAAQTPPWTR